MVKTSGFKKKKRLQVSIAGDMRFIPGWGTRIPCAMERSQKKKKKGKRESKMSASINPSIYTVILSLSLGFCYILDPVLGLGT